MTEELRIARLGAQGDGVAEDGRLFVPFALPGETVRIERTVGDRARLERVVAAAPERVAPPCALFGQCGGCALQHASDSFVAAWKRDLVRSALAARGIEGVEIAEVETVPPGSRRRITVAVERTGGRVRIGFHAAGSHLIVPVSACVVARPELIEILPALDEIIAHCMGRKGALRLTLTHATAGVDCAVTGGRTLNGPALALLAGKAARAGLARLSVAGEIAVTRMAPVQRMGRARVVPPPGGFLQPTVEGEALLLAAVTDAVGEAARIADLFAGSGTFTLPLAERAEVLAVEGDGEAVAALDAGWRGAPGLRRVRAERRDLFARPLRRDELQGLEAVVIDPPRAGARAQAEELAKDGPPRIASVSCNPATFARDARILLDGGYALDWVRPVDQFRWSPHLELVGAFRR